MKNNGNDVLQIGSGPGTYWMNDGVWGAAALTLGTYTGENGTQFEQAAGVSPNLGPNGEISWRMTWKWPVGHDRSEVLPERHHRQQARLLQHLDARLAAGM